MPTQPYQDIMCSSSPFENFRARSLLTWPSITIVVLGVYTYFAVQGTWLSAGKDFLLGIIIYSVLFAWILTQCRKHGISILRLIGRIPSKASEWGFLLIVIPSYLFGYGSVWLIRLLRYELLHRFGSSGVTQWLDIQPDITPGVSIWTIAFGIVVVLVGPVAEEIIFRGLFLHRWRHKWGLKWGLSLSSIVFGLVHQNFIYSFVFGMVLALLYIHLRTLIIPIACHALYNLSSLILQSKIISWTWRDPKICLVLSVPVLIIFLYKYWPNKEAKLPLDPL